MKDAPNAFYALLFVALACGIAVVALYAPYRENTTMAVITLATSIVTGAFGYIQGHSQGVKDGQAKAVKTIPATPVEEDQPNGSTNGTSIVSGG